MGLSWALELGCPLAHQFGLYSCASDHESRLRSRLATQVLPVAEGFPSFGPSSTASRWTDPAVGSTDSASVGATSWARTSRCAAWLPDRLPATGCRDWRSPATRGRAAVAACGRHRRQRPLHGADDPHDRPSNMAVRGRAAMAAGYDELASEFARPLHWR